MTPLELALENNLPSGAGSVLSVAFLFSGFSPSLTNVSLFDPSGREGREWIIEWIIRTSSSGSGR